MTPLLDLTGSRFGKVVVLNRAEDRGRQPYWRCRCDCGVVKDIRGAHLKAGKISSCGCGRGNFVHGMAHSRLWAVWKAMKQRCSNPNTTAFHRYGGRGITYTQEWETFPEFSKWAVAHGYADHLELDRIDNDGDYVPENCRFISHRENSRKTGSVTMIEFEGEALPLFLLAERYGLERNTLKTRLRRGWSVQRALEPSKIDRKKERR